MTFGTLAVFVLCVFFYVFIMLVPNRHHHSKKAQKPRLKPQAVRARKAALKALKRKLLAP